MIFPVRSQWRLTTEFWESRPLSAGYADRTHPHAAWDIGCRVGTEIRAPETGKVVYLWVNRADNSRQMQEIQIPREPFNILGHWYFYDIYGGLTFLIGDSGMTHLFAHSYLNQILNKSPLRPRWASIESAEEERWPVCGLHSFDDPQRVSLGSVIGYCGNAGYSQGPHIHYEIHDGATYNAYSSRIDPALIYSKEWDEHRGELQYDWMAERERWRG